MTICKIDNQNPEWLTLSSFEAKTTVTDKVTRFANTLIFGMGLFGLYASTAGSSGLLTYASSLSLGLTLRKVAAAAIGYVAYPAALTSFSGNDSIIERGKGEEKQLRENGFIVRTVTFYKSGTRYDARLITHPKTINNGNWTINAMGNGMVFEHFLTQYAQNNYTNNCNTLLVNGPSVSQSGGWPTRYQMGAAYETGICFLEEKVKAKHIIMHGLSLGGGMMAEAILRHDFTEGMKNNVRYLVTIDRSFSRLSTIASELVGPLVLPILYVTNAELDGVAAACKLSRLDIRQIIIQNPDSDGVIPKMSSLAKTLHQEQTLRNKVFLESPYISHNGALPDSIRTALEKEIKKFLLCI